MTAITTTNSKQKTSPIPNNQNDNTERNSKDKQNLQKQPTLPSRPKHETIRFIQTNLQHKKSAMDTLAINLIGNKNTIIMATEPYVNKKGKIQQINKSTTWYHTSKETPRAAIGVHKKVATHVNVIDTLTDKDTTVIKIRNKSNTHIVASIYMDQNKDIPTEKITALTKIANDTKATLIITSDTNAHHKIWGDKNTDKRGEDLLNTLTQNSLDIVNNGNKPTFTNTRDHKSIIDVTMSNSKGTRDITNWHVSDQFTNSDHKYIRFSITTETPMKTKFSDIKNTDWNKYSEDIRNDRFLKTLENINITSQETLNQITAQLTETLIRHWTNNTPETHISGVNNTPEWYTKEIKEEHDKIKSTYKNKNMSHEEKIDKLRELTKIHNKTITTAKKNNYRKLLQNINTIPAAARFSKIMKGQNTNTRNRLNTIKRKDGSYTQSDKETLSEMIQAHYPDTDSIKITSPDNSKDQQSIDQTTSTHRIRLAIQSLKNGKSPGPDLIANEMIKTTAGTLTPILQKIFTYSFSTGQIPEIWKISKGIFHPKPGKDDYTNPKAYRTLTLSPTMLKLKERLVLWHLEHDKQIYDQLSKKQYGFRKGFSTEAALHKIVHKIEKRTKKKGMVLGIFLDIEGAFDKVSFEAIGRALERFNIDGNSKRWILSWLQDRKLITTLHETQEKITIHRGVPQGGVLSPLIWLLVMDSLLRKTPKELPTDTQGYADDLISTTEGYDIKIMEQRIQTTTNTINKWCQEQGLKLSAIKTTVILFSTKHQPPKVKINIDGQRINNTDHTKFLGITLDSKLNFKLHIEQRTTQAIRKLLALKSTMGTTWGTSPKTTKWLYTAIIRPALDYGAIVWCPTLNKKYITQQFRKVQNFALKITTGASPTSAQADLNIITDTNDIIAHLQGKCVSTATNIKCNNNWTNETPTNNGHVHYIQNLQNKINTGKEKWDLTTQTLTLDKNYTTVTPKASEHQQYHDNTRILQSNENLLHCYTDGSKDEHGNTGSGVHIKAKANQIIETNRKYKLTAHTTVFQAEIIAIQKAAETLTEYNITGEQIYIWSDSKSAIQALTNPIIKSKTVKAAHNELQKVGKLNHITLAWVKAHIGTPGNEKADQLAKEATTDPSPPIYSYTPTSVLKSNIQRWQASQTIQELENRGGKHTKRVLADPKQSFTDGSTDDIKIKITEVHRLTKFYRTNCRNRQTIRLLTHLLTQQGPNNHFLHKIGKAPTNDCSLCHTAPETIEHIICKCPATANRRHAITGIYYTNNIYDTLRDIPLQQNIAILQHFLEQKSKIELDQ